MTSIRFLLLTSACTTLLLAQSSSTITGLVSDSSKAPVPRAKVTVIGVETGVQIRTTTNQDGYYTVPSLQPIRYKVTAEFAGFETAVSHEFKLDTTETARIDLVLAPSGTRQTIEVVATAGAEIETQNSMTGNTVSQKEIDSLPLNGRNSLELAMTLPGIAGDVGSDEGGIYQTTPSAGAGLVIGGGRTASSAFMADGASATSVTLGRQTVTFSSDTIQEFKVITSTFSAQYGVSGGGIVSTVSKSGTNQLHGNAFYFQRNPTIAARQFNSPLPPPFRRNEGGFTVGGPVWLPKIYNGKSKTFFFFSFEPKRWVDATVNYIRVPTTEERAGDFRNTWVAPGQQIPLLYRQVECIDAQCSQLRALNRANNTTVYPLFSAGVPGQEGLVIPKQYLDPLVQTLLKDVPLSNMPYDSNGNNYVGARGVSGRDNRWNFKIDHNVSSANRLTFRFTNIPNFSERYLIRKQDYSLMSYPSDTSLTRQAFLSDTHTISSRIVNEFRSNFTYSNYSSIAPGDLGTHNYTKDFGLPNITSWGYPRFNISGFLAPSLGMGNHQLLGNYLEQQFQFADDLTMTFGRHTIITGIDWRFMQSNVKAGGLGDACCGQYSFTSLTLTQSGNANIPTGAGGNSFANFLLGVPASASLRGVLMPYYYRWRVGSGFVQDDLKLKSNLTLNIGLRWQFNSPRAEKFNRQASIDLNNPVPMKDAQGRVTGYTLNYVYSGAGTGSKYLEPVHKANFEPRFGFAWTPGFDWNSKKVFVIRGGYGISHAPQTGRGRDPLPDFGAGSSGSWNYTQWTGNGAAPVTQSLNPQYLISVGRNAPTVIADPLILQVPSDGKLCAGCTPKDPRVPSGNLIAFMTNNQVPYVQTWNMTTQYSLPRNYVLTLTYMGQKGTHLFSPVYNLNNPDLAQYQNLLDAGGDPTQTVPDPFGRVDASGNQRNVQLQDLMRPYPTMGDITVAGVTSSNSIYNAGIAEIERRFRGWLGFRFNYTWSKSIDNSSSGSMDSGSWTYGRAQNPQDLKGNRSVSFYDSRNRLNLTANINLPFGAGRFQTRSRFIDRMVLSGWSVNVLTSYYSGTPFAPYLNDTNGIPGGNTRPQEIFPDIVLGVPFINPRWNKSVANSVPYINPEAFARPAFGRMGNASRTLDYVRNPWIQNNNMSLFKEIRPFENKSRYIQLRGEFFNVFNHTFFQLNQNSSVNMFTGSLPLSRTGVSLAGPLPYLPGKVGAYPAGTREAYLASAWNQSWGSFLAANNASGRMIQLAIKLYW